MLQQNAQFRQNNGFCMVWREPLSEYAAFDSDSSYNWKMNCMDLFHALIPYLFDICFME